MRRDLIETGEEYEAIVPQTRERLRRLVDELPERELGTAERFLRYLRDTEASTRWEALKEAPFDDEVETAEEAEAVDAAREQARNGDVVAWEDVRARLANPD